MTVERCEKLLMEENSSSVCGENEHFTQTKASCQMSCYTHYNQQYLNEKNCHNKKIAGCVCNDNYVRDTANGRCIEISKCSSEPEISTIQQLN
jgi:hypothetical protein